MAKILFSNNSLKSVEIANGNPVGINARLIGRYRLMGVDGALVKD
jgi:hypothetical protein